MSKKMQTNQKHKNQNNRIVIEKDLDASKPISTIAPEPDKDPTTISKEIKKHRNAMPAGSVPYPSLLGRVRACQSMENGFLLSTL